MDDKVREWVGELLDRIGTEQTARVKGLEDTLAQLRDDYARERDENRRLWLACGRLQHAIGLSRADSGSDNFVKEQVEELKAADAYLGGIVPLVPAPKPPATKPSAP